MQTLVAQCDHAAALSMSDTLVGLGIGLGWSVYSNAHGGARRGVLAAFVLDGSWQKGDAKCSAASLTSRGVLFCHRWKSLSSSVVSVVKETFGTIGAGGRTLSWRAICCTGAFWLMLAEAPMDGCAKLNLLDGERF